jgi:7-carboxy-7-deazaguanine synthase
MWITEIKESLQGEGKYTGYLTTFIRTHSCNLFCTYCDSRYACDGPRKSMSLKKIMESVNQLGNRYVCLTGGEPLLQDEIYPLVYELCLHGYIVNVETNGSIPIDQDNYQRSFVYTMDIKCPSSGMAAKNCYKNLANLQARDEVKFVISDYTDYIFAKGILKQYPTKAAIIFSPVFVEGKNAGKELAQWIMEDNLQEVRLGIQQHKLLNIY